MLDHSTGVLLSFNEAAAVLPRMILIPPSYRTATLFLQWGRGSVAADDQRERFAAARSASTFNEAAAVLPRMIAPLCRTVQCVRPFNEAAAVLPRMIFAQLTAERRVVRLQWGRGSVAADDVMTVTSAGIHLGTLQWGRGSVAADDAPPIAPADAERAFNEAAAVLPRMMTRHDRPTLSD